MTTILHVEKMMIVFTFNFQPWKWSQTAAEVEKALVPIQRIRRRTELEDSTDEIEQDKENESSLYPAEHNIQKDCKALKKEYRSQLLEIKFLKANYCICAR